jgi:glutamyl-Q tRNA(Asp) synthetase
MPQYIGRFAPTPTGPLHFGSLVAALASYLDAKSHNGTWLLRIEDLDPPREDKAASELIPKQLLEHGLQWDGEIEFQSQHSSRYEHYLEKLRNLELLFPCTCSRKNLSPNKGLHLGNCDSSTNDPHAWRLSVPNDTYSFTDRVYGENSQNLAEVGDQVLKRKDGLYAYQLAVVVDDYESGINHVVRGLDLLDNTPRQLYLMQCLGIKVPSYLHIPLITNDLGQKLSKQNQAQALNLTTIEDNLLRALTFLKQPPVPLEPQQDSQSILNWAIQNWQVSEVPPLKAGLIP